MAQYVHHFDVMHSHACGCVQPGDAFTLDLPSLTCNECIRMQHNKVQEARVERGATEFAKEAERLPVAREIVVCDFCGMSPSSPDTFAGLKCPTCGKIR